MSRQLFEVVMPTVLLYIVGFLIGWAIASLLRRRRKRLEARALAEVDRHAKLATDALLAHNYEKYEFHHEQASLAMDRAGLSRLENR